MTQGEKVGRGEGEVCRICGGDHHPAVSAAVHRDLIEDLRSQLAELKRDAADTCEALTITHGLGYNSRNDEVRKLEKEVAELRAKVGDATRVTTDAMEMANAAEKRAQELMHERDEALSTLEFMNDQKDALLHALEEGRRIAKERDEARGLLMEAHGKLASRHYEQDVGDLMRRIDAHRRKSP